MTVMITKTVLLRLATIFTGTADEQKHPKIFH